MKHFLASLLALTLFISCSKDDKVKDYTAQNEKEIVDYLAKNNLTAQRTASGLYYIITKEGEGEEKPTIKSTVTVRYSGKFTNEKVFDQSVEPVSFPLSRLIPAWKEGIPLLKAKGECILFVPSHLGYGSTGNQNIPGGAVLIFNITLDSFN